MEFPPEINPPIKHYVSVKLIKKQLKLLLNSNLQPDFELSHLILILLNSLFQSSRLSVNNYNPFKNLIIRI
jgi:hypothetical protein